MPTALLERSATPFPAVELLALPSTPQREQRERRGYDKLPVRMMKLAMVSLVVFLAVGNLVILAASAWAKSGVGDSVRVAGVKNFRMVDDRLWRGAAPTEEGYASLAGRGVTTIVDLRAERGIEVPEEVLAAAGVKVVPIAIRDGQTPTGAQVREFLGVVEQSPGPVFVHCGAGVGRTGAMVAAYVAATGQASGPERVFDNLAVGPPSLEQIVYAAGLERGDFERPNVAFVAASRVLDAPRRILHSLGF